MNDDALAEIDRIWHTPSPEPRAEPMRLLDWVCVVLITVLTVVWWLLLVWVVVFLADLVR